MNLNLIQQQSLKLTVTPQLQQAITMLQLNIHELSEYLYEQAIDNPFIDIKVSRKNRKSSLRAFEDTGLQDRWDSKKRITLKQFLMSQLSECDVTIETRKNIEYLIFHLDSNGFLVDSTGQFAKELAVTKEKIEEALYILQTFDPEGVGARGVQESLLIQAKMKYSSSSLEVKMLSDHFSLFVNKKWKEIARKEKNTEELVKLAGGNILQLQPRPGISFAEEDTTYVVADVYVEKVDNEWVVKLNEEELPKLRWNKNYDLQIRNKLESDEIQYIKAMKTQFDWLEKCIFERKQTIVSVMKAIIEKQLAFFEKGPSYLKGCTLIEIADMIGVHESTVSRVSRSKYVQTPYGLHPIKYFFSSAIKGIEGEETISATSVQILIKELVERENKEKPLSDQKITDMLFTDYKIEVARRTVSKYREALRIPSASKRKG